MISELDRTVSANELLEEVIKIAGNSNVKQEVPELKKLVSFMDEVGVAVFMPPCNRANPGKNAGMNAIFKFLPNSKRPAERCLTFYPMYKTDAQIDKVCEFYAQMVSLAAYGPKNNNIVLDMSVGETLRMSACSFIHELGHAHLAYLQGRIFGAAKQRIEQERHLEEVKIWTRDYKLMLAMGGRKYSSAAKDLAYDVWQWWKQKKEPVDWTGKGAVLNDFLGVPASQICTLCRDSSISVYCHLMAADTYLPEGLKLRQKIEVIKQITGTHYQVQDSIIEQFTR